MSLKDEICLGFNKLLNFGGVYKFLGKLCGRHPQVHTSTNTWQSYKFNKWDYAMSNTYLDKNVMDLCTLQAL
jgi:hypothetical protein